MIAQIQELELWRWSFSQQWMSQLWSFLELLQEEKRSDIIYLNFLWHFLKFFRTSTRGEKVWNNDIINRAFGTFMKLFGKVWNIVNKTFLWHFWSIWKSWETLKLSIKLLELFGTATRKPPYIIFNKDSFPLSSLSMKLFGTVPLMKKLFQVDYESFDFEGMLIDLLWNRSVALSSF